LQGIIGDVEDQRSAKGKKEKKMQGMGAAEVLHVQQDIDKPRRS
jgi:hypothetical protein